MKIGDLVKPVRAVVGDADFYRSRLLVEDDWKGIIIGFKCTDVIVFWNEDFPEEWEYPEQLEVINEGG